MTVLNKIYQLIKTYKAKKKKKIVGNHFLNILQLFDVLANFPFTTREKMSDCFL